MKTWLWLGLVLAILGTGCGRDTAPASLTQTTLVKQAPELESAVLMRMFLEAVEKEGATNVSARFQTSFNEAMIQKLMAEAPSELRRKLETLERRTNRHPFTEQQLKEALRRRSS